MDRKQAWEDYQRDVAGRIQEFKRRMDRHLPDQALWLEELVRNAMGQMGKKLKEEQKEGPAFLCFSFLKTDLIRRRYRLCLMAMTLRWYLEKEPSEIYVDTGDLMAPFDQLWEELTKAGRIYRERVNAYDIQNIMFDQLKFVDSSIARILRRQLKEREKREIFNGLEPADCWILTWGEYRDRSEVILEADCSEADCAEAACSETDCSGAGWGDGECSDPGKSRPACRRRGKGV